MGQLITKCSCKKKFEVDSEEDEESGDSMNSLPDDNEINKLFKTRNEIPTINSDIQFKTDSLIRAYNFSPYQIYDELSSLGEGAYGQVKKVCLKNNKQTIRAMKIISKQNVIEGELEKLFEEIEILRKLEHPNIMKIYEYFIDENNIYIISEFCDSGDLLGKLNKLHTMSEVIVKYLMIQILDALSYLHSNRVFHGDIKLENIMLYKATKKKSKRFTIISKELNFNLKLQKDIDNKKGKISPVVEEMSLYEIKLIDFGCSKYLTKRKNNVLTGIVGTSIYCSPEVIDNSYDEKSDEWSCGVLMFILLCGFPPFEGETEEEIFENIKKYNIDFNCDNLKYVSENCKDLMKKLMNPNKKHRITASEALKHPFFTQKFNPKKILTKDKDLSILKKFLTVKKYPSILHKVVVAYCCFNFISKDEERKLKELFVFLDTKNAKKLTLEDFQRGFKEANIPISLFDLKNILSLLDTDGSQSIEYQEFLRALCDKDSLLNDQNLRAVFDVIDKDKKGFANLEDIKQFIIGDRNSNVKASTVKLLEEQINMKENSEINFEQFLDLIRKEKLENNTLKKTKTHFNSSSKEINERKISDKYDKKSEGMRKNSIEMT